MPHIDSLLNSKPDIRRCGHFGIDAGAFDRHIIMDFLGFGALACIQNFLGRRIHRQFIPIWNGNRVETSIQTIFSKRIFVWSQQPEIIIAGLQKALQMQSAYADQQNHNGHIVSLRLQGISRISNGETHIYPTDIEFQKGTMNVLLGPTAAGKTSLMRLMAGLDRPDTGEIYWQDENVTGARVQDRDIAMVYQQFVNYPSMTVFENIASPLKLQKKSRAEVDSAVREMAGLLQISSILDRKPHEISGGQQQRCAMARALVKNVGLVLMDEPLANLDYKLREELRVEIPRLFEASGSIFVYATTEPEEALLLGGNTATLSDGRVTQFGPALDVYRHPVDMTTARIYSDPPMNFVTVKKEGNIVQFPNGQSTKASDSWAASPDGEYKAGFRSHHLELSTGSSGAIEFEALLIVTELTGSDTFLHLETMNARWIGLAPGLQNFEPGQDLKVWLNPENIYFFDKNRKLIGSPVFAAGEAGG